jgi:multidrug resistance efflux pump
MCGLYFLNKEYGQSSPTFYGFAENKEMQINMEYPVAISRVVVTSGQSVKKGDLLLEVTRQTLEHKESEVAYNITELQAKGGLHRSDLMASLGKLRSQKAERKAETEAQIAAIEAEVSLNRSLVKGLKSIRIDESKTTENSLFTAKIARLRDELRFAITPIEIEIKRIESELNNVDPLKVQIDHLKNEKQLIEKEQEKLSIYAPTDGLIGTIHCKEGENIQSFAVMISFYEQNPNQVVAFVHESLLLKIKINDSLLVTSSLRPDEKAMGSIVGLGHRIVEIPERLRRIPEMRTYGREVLISIPLQNHFLQNEKVVLNIIDTEKKTWAGQLIAAVLNKR